MLDYQNVLLAHIKPPQTTHILVYEYLDLSELRFWKLFNLNSSSPIQVCGDFQLESVDARTPSIWLKFSPDYFHRLYNNILTEVRQNFLDRSNVHHHKFYHIHDSNYWKNDSI